MYIINEHQDLDNEEASGQSLGLAEWSDNHTLRSHLDPSRGRNQEESLELNNQTSLILPLSNKQNNQKSVRLVSQGLARGLEFLLLHEGSKGLVYP